MPGTVPPRFEPADGWVPADQRWFGLDRRTIAPTLTVFALAAAMSVVLPLVDAAIPYRDLVRAGDVIELRGEVTFVPDVGWGITSGVRAGRGPASGDYPDRATIVNEDTTFTVRTATFHGDANALLDQIEETADALNRGRGIHVVGERTTIVTDQGKQGATARITGPRRSGIIAAFVFDGRGVEAQATEGSEVGQEPAAAVLRMIHSINSGERSGERGERVER